MENKKSNKGVIAILIILIIIVLALSSYIVYDKFFNAEDDKKVTENNTKDENKTEDVLPEKNAKYTYVDMIKKDITLSGKKHTLLTYYYKDDIAGNETTLYMVYNEIYFDNKKVLDINLDNGFTEESERTIYINDLKNTNSDNKFIKDLKDDKEYKIIEYKMVDKLALLGGLDHTYKKALLVDENGNVLDDYYLSYPCTTLSMYVNVPSSMIEDRTSSNGVLYSNSYLDIHDNYMYYFDTSMGQNKALDSVDEYKITIENGVVNKVKTRSYSGNELVGAGGC